MANVTIYWKDGTQNSVPDFDLGYWKGQGWSTTNPKATTTPPVTTTPPATGGGTSGTTTSSGTVSFPNKGAIGYVNGKLNWYPNASNAGSNGATNVSEYAANTPITPIKFVTVSSTNGAYKNIWLTADDAKKALNGKSEWTNGANTFRVDPGFEDIITAPTTNKATLYGPNGTSEVVDVGSARASELQSKGWGLTAGSYRAPVTPPITTPETPATPPTTPGTQTGESDKIIYKKGTNLYVKNGNIFYKIPDQKTLEDLVFNKGYKDNRTEVPTNAEIGNINSTPLIPGTTGDTTDKKIYKKGSDLYVKTGDKYYKIPDPATLYDLVTNKGYQDVRETLPTNAPIGDFGEQPIATPTTPADKNIYKRGNDLYIKENDKFYKIPDAKTLQDYVLNKGYKDTRGELPTNAIIEDFSSAFPETPKVTPVADDKNIYKKGNDLYIYDTSSDTYYKIADTKQLQDLVFNQGYDDTRKDLPTGAKTSNVSIDEIPAPPAPTPVTQDKNIYKKGNDLYIKDDSGIFYKIKDTTQLQDLVFKQGYDDTRLDLPTDAQTSNVSIDEIPSTNAGYDPFEKALELGYTRDDFANDPGFEAYWKNKTPEQLAAALAKRQDFDATTGVKKGAPAPETPEETPDLTDLFSSMINVDPFLAAQLEDPALRAQFDSLDPSLKMQYLMNLRALKESIEAGQVVNPNLEITPEQTAAFEEQAKAKVAGYYDELIGNETGDLKTKLSRMKEDFTTGVGRAEEMFKENLSNQAESAAQSGLAFGSSRGEKVSKTIKAQQEGLSDASLEMARSQQDLATAAERKIGSSAFGNLGLDTSVQNYNVGEGGFSQAGTRSLFTPQGNIVGEIPKQREVDVINERNNLIMAEKQKRILDNSQLNGNPITDWSSVISTPKVATSVTSRPNITLANGQVISGTDPNYDEYAKQYPQTSTTSTSTTSQATPAARQIAIDGTGTTTPTQPVKVTTPTTPIKNDVWSTGNNIGWTNPDGTTGKVSTPITSTPVTTPTPTPIAPTPVTPVKTPITLPGGQIISPLDPNYGEYAGQTKSGYITPGVNMPTPTPVTVLHPEAPDWKEGDPLPALGYYNGMPTVGGNTNKGSMYDSWGRKKNIAY